MRDLDYFAYGSNLHPLRFDWYLDYVLRGGRYHGLSGRYLAALARTERQRDSNSARRHSNRRVLVSGTPPRLR